MDDYKKNVSYIFDNMVEKKKYCREKGLYLFLFFNDWAQRFLHYALCVIYVSFFSFFKKKILSCFVDNY